MTRQQKEMIILNVLGAHRIIEINNYDAIKISPQIEKRCICGKSPAQLSHISHEIVLTLERFEKLENKDKK